jgi:Domain of unknown function (DUF4258)
MYSKRFDRAIVVSTHARIRMAQRNINEKMLLEVIETGEVRYKDAAHLWVFKEFASRQDNLLCAVLILEDCVVVKTVMHHFTVL